MKLILAFLFSVWAQANCTLEIKTDSPIGPGTYDYVQRALEEAKQKSCGSILYLINTPGGSLQSTRLIVESIVNSPIPFLCLVHPSGGHAGSAGAIILQACHVNGAMEATNIGAATPVTLGPALDKDMHNKVVNDTVSWLYSLVELRGRNKDFAKDIVEKAKAVEAKEALKLGAIDFVSTSVEDFLQQSANKTVKMSGGGSQKISVGEILKFPPDTRFAVLDLVTHPEIAYLIFMASLALLYFEITHTGLIAPGVFGALGLVLSLISFHMLEVQWGGFALIVLGIGFMIAEIFVPAYGSLGIGGIIALVFGSLFLFDPKVGHLPLGIILPTVVALAFAFLGIGYLAARTRGVAIKNNNLVGQTGTVTVVHSDGITGKLEVAGEIWNFESMDELKPQETVMVKGSEGLKLIVFKMRAKES